MAKPRTNLTIDLLQLFVGIIVLTSGIIMWVVLPPGEGGDRQNDRQGAYYPVYYDDTDDATETFIVDRHTWRDVHLVAALSLAGLVALHFLLHWNWLMCMLRPKKKKPTEACKEE